MGKHRGRRRKAKALALPPPKSKAKRTVATATASNLAATWSFEAELRKLGTCPIVSPPAIVRHLAKLPPALRSKEREMRRTKEGRKAWRQMFKTDPFLAERVAVRRASRYLPEVAEMMVAAARPDRNEVKAAQAWIDAHHALVEQDRAIRQQSMGVGMVDVENDRKTGLPVARFGNDRGTAERARQDGGLTTTTAPNSDRASQPVTVARGSDTLGRLLRNQTINHRELKVAQRFKDNFSRALFDRYPTMKLERVEKGVCEGGHSIVEARDAVAAALKLLGGQASQQGDLMWRVVGQDMPLRDWVTHWSMFHAGRLNLPIATGLLKGALCTLHNHYFPESENQVVGMPPEDPLLYRNAGLTGEGKKAFAERAAEWHSATTTRERVA